MPADCALSLDNVTVVPRSFFVERVWPIGTSVGMPLTVRVAGTAM